MEAVQIGSGSWKTLKDDLVKQGVLHSIFTTPLKVSSKELSTVQFEPVLLSTHVEMLEDLCEKCLALRREIRELEILAVKALMDYELFQKTSAIDEEAETLRLLQTSKVAEKLGQDRAANAFGDAPAINNGFREASVGRSHALDEDLKGVGRLSNLIKERWAHVRSYQQAYYARYREPGNAHNYSERAEHLQAILREELDEAIARAWALQIGLKTVYNWSPGEVPKEVDLATLDSFLIWVLEARRGLRFRAERETCYDIVIPLVQPWSGGKVGLIAKETFDAAVAADTTEPISLRFEMPSAIFFNRNVRLKGVGLSFGNKFGLVIESGIDRIQTGDGFAKLAAVILTPEQITADGKKYRRPDIILGNIGLHDSRDPVAYVEGNAVTNLSPVGSWEIRLHPWMVWKEAGTVKLRDGAAGERIKDLKLTFRVYIPAQS